MYNFITGGSGMVGSHLIDLLMKESNEPSVILMRVRSSFENIEQWIPEIEKGKGSRIFVEYGDLNDANSLLRIFAKYDIGKVYHLAAQSYPKTSFDAPHETLSTNILGTLNLLEASRTYAPKAKIHVCSSSEVFGRVPKDRIPITEEEGFHPASPYAISKAGTDLLGRFYAEAYEMNVVVTRMFTHTGPRRGDVFAESTFAKQIALIEAGHAKPVVKVGNLKSLRTFADARDAVRAYHTLVNADPFKSDYYNIGGTHTCTVGEMLDYLLSISSRNDIKIAVDQNRIRPIDADLQVPDCSKFNNNFKWNRQYSFEDTMTDLLNYWRVKIANNPNILTR